MKVLLVDNLVMPEEGSVAALDVHPHLGLLALAASAQAHGHLVEIFDPKRLVRDGTLPYDGALYRLSAERLLAADPDVVGFTALGCSFLYALNVARLLKARRPGLPILLGGPHATILHREIMAAYPAFDAIVRHEADRTFPQVLVRLADRSFEEIEGISWRDAEGVVRETAGKPKIDDLDSLSLTDYALYPVETLGLDLLRIEAGRGCPFACTFCSTAGFFQRSFRLKSPERLVAELDRLSARYGLRRFKLDHDMFTASKKKVAAFCEAVAGRGYRWSVSARVDCVDPPLLRKMAAAGCENLYFGIETGSPRMQRITHKRLNLDLVEPILAEADHLGLETTASFIAGFPEESQEHLDLTLDMIGRCLRRPSCLAQLHLLAPEPGTPLAATLGDTILYDGTSGPYSCAPLTAEDEAEIRRAPTIFQTYYHYPALLPRSRVIRAVDTVDLMRRAGPLVSSYLLRFFDGRLSRLVAALDAEADDGEVRLDAPALLAFAAGRFGPGHHLTCLLRYALHQDAAAPPANARAGIFSVERPYRVSPSLHTLPSMPDCAALLARIAALPEGATLPEDDAPGDRLYLSFRGRVYETEQDLLPLLEQFRRPRTPRSLLDQLGLTKSEAAARRLAELAKLGLIEPAIG